MAREFRVGLRTVQRWLARAGDGSLDAVDWSSRSSRPHRGERTAPGLEDLILELRRELRETSILGEYGAAAIRRALVEAEQPGPLPSVRTIGRILERRGALDHRGRVRRPPPPVGWYLPDLAARVVELDSFDVIEGLRLRGGRNLDVLTAISLHGALPAAWVEPGVSSRSTVRALSDHWRAAGLPGYAQFDNDPRFYGSHANPDVFGPVVRLCLGLGVVPVFAPARDRLPGRRRELQRSLAGEGVEPLLERGPGRAGDPLGALCRRAPAPSRGQDRVRPRPTTDPGGLAAGPAGGAPGAARLPAPDELDRDGERLRAHLRSRRELALPARPG